jgi:hypothetical protein
MIESDNPILYDIFRKLICDFRKAIIIVAFSSALFSAFGATLLGHLSWIREGRNAIDDFISSRFFFGVCVLALGGYIMDQMHGFLDFFAAFDNRTSSLVAALYITELWADCIWWPCGFVQPPQPRVSFSCPLAVNITEPTQAEHRQEAGKKKIPRYQITSLLL